MFRSYETSSRQAGQKPAGAPLIFDLLVLRLGLAFDQKAQLEAVREEMRAVVQQLLTTAREEFLTLLSEEQLTLLNTLE